MVKLIIQFSPFFFSPTRSEGKTEYPEIPQNRFSHGDMVLISRRDPIKETGKTITGTILEKNAHFIKISVAQIPDQVRS